MKKIFFIIVITGIFLLLLYIPIKAMTNAHAWSDTLAMMGFIAFFSIIYLLAMRRYLPKKKVLAYVRDKGLKRGSAIDSERVKWIDLQIQNKRKVKRFFFDKENDFRFVQRGKVYTFLVSGTTIYGIKK